MAGSLEGSRKCCMRGYGMQGFVRISLLSILTMWMNLATTSFGEQQPPGFLTLNCGGPGSLDPLSGLYYASDIDSTLILTGNSSMNISTTIKTPFRFFPERRNKYCYELPTKRNTKYMIRVRFDWQPALVRPIKFVVYINATNVFTVAYSASDNSSEYWLGQLYDGILYSPGSVMYICLQPVIGTPFISYLVLRELDPSMYSYPGSDRQHLANMVRSNIGAGPPDFGSILRYPDDSYDRFWHTPESGWYNDLTILNTTTPPDPKPRPETNYVPPKVMEDAWVGSQVMLLFYLYADSPLYISTPADYAYVVLYAEELNPNSAGGTMVVELDGIRGPDLIVSKQASMSVNSNFILSSSVLNISVSAAADSMVSINALEIYAQYNFNFSTTTPTDDAAITILKESLSLNDWQGDPCTPVPHDWLSCDDSSISLAAPVRQPCGSTSAYPCVVQPGFLRRAYYVTSLTFSNMPSLDFGTLQNNAAKSPGIMLNMLEEMYITGSTVDLSAFKFLINNFSGGALTVLDFTNNMIENVPLASDWAGLNNLVSLNLSQNRLAGELSPFENVPFFNTLQELNLSHNAMSSLPSTWQNTTNGLVVLDLSHNNLMDDISSLDLLVKMNSNSLRELDVSNNSLTGTFPSALYFSQALSNLTFANFEGNSIQGTLDVSVWLDALEKNGAQASKTLFSLVNNRISDIFPNANALEPTIKSLRDKKINVNKSILLGGNPYCSGARSDIQRFLCRSTTSEDYSSPKSNHNKDIMIIGICLGVVSFVLSIIAIATIWKFWKQVYALREIQQALADQKVQPPFYQYSDLKSATRDFHEDNKLGHGAFGEVYMAVLPDKTGLAVKTLFNSQKVQVLNEFLNEVVLITGIKHRNLVHLKGCCIREQQRMLVFEYVEKGNLAQALWGSKPHGGLDWAHRFQICVGVARGLSYLHEELQPSIVHRDIKPENILLDKNFKPKIADFGLARHLSEELRESLYTKVAGTLGYFSPEYAMQGQLSDKADVYSYGIVVLEIICGRKCIDYTLPDAVFLKDWVHKMHRKGLLLDVLEPASRDKCVVTEVLRALNVGLLCVQNDPDRRPSMSQVVFMLMGNIDVEVTLEESEDTPSQFKHLFRTTDDQMAYSSFQTVVETNLLVSLA